MKAVILAGGKGTRLLPYTAVMPKALVPIDGTAILEIVLRQLGSCGFSDINICLGHLSAMIRTEIGSGEQLGVRATYTQEDSPLGTAGPLRLVSDLPDNFVFMNSDILTNLDYRKFLETHIAQGCDLSIATYCKDVATEFGIIESEGNKVTRYIEKPVHSYDVSMGIYAIKREVLKYIPENRYFDFPALVTTLLAANREIFLFRFRGLWFDIGGMPDLEQGTAAFKSNRSLFLPSG